VWPHDDDDGIVVEWKSTNIQQGFRVVGLGSEVPLWERAAQPATWCVFPLAFASARKDGCPHQRETMMPMPVGCHRQSSVALDRQSARVFAHWGLAAARVEQRAAALRSP
jgi:hypothetical protein